MIFELIQGEMQYVRDLENIDVVSDAINRPAYVTFDPRLPCRCTCSHYARQNHPSSPANGCRLSSRTSITISARCTHKTASCSIVSMQSSVTSTRSLTVSLLRSSMLRSTGVMNTWSTLRTIPSPSIAWLTKWRTILPSRNFGWWVHGPRTAFVTLVYTKSAASSPVASHAASRGKPSRHEALRVPSDPTSWAVRATAQGHHGGQFRGSRRSR